MDLLLVRLPPCPSWSCWPTGAAGVAETGVPADALGAAIIATTMVNRVLNIVIALPVRRARRPSRVRRSDVLARAAIVMRRPPRGGATTVVVHDPGDNAELRCDRAGLYIYAQYLSIARTIMHHCGAARHSLSRLM